MVNGHQCPTVAQLRQRALFCQHALFYRSHFIKVYCHMFITICVILEFMSHRSSFKNTCLLQL